MTTSTTFTEPGVTTAPGQYAELFADLPADVPTLRTVGHGLLIHDYLAADFYDVELSEEDKKTTHIRRIDQLLERITAADGRALDVRREPSARTAVNCRHFTVLMVTLLRAKGFPARSRCGFGNYFGSDFNEDHWVAEYFDGTRWALVDAQIDDVQLARWPIDFDLTDVPRDRFLIGGQAWAMCRAGEADPANFGLSSIPEEAGYGWIAGNMMRDAAALTGVEVLPWDTWGGMPDVPWAADDDRVKLFDQLAELTRQPDAHLDELRRLLGSNDRLRVPAKVHNELRGADELI